MNEAQGQGPASGFDAAAGAEAASAGTLLRLAREEAGLQVDTLAAALKVPVRKLEALEADRFDLLPDAVFVRGLAASVCRNLKLDPAPILQLLPASGAPRLAPTEGGINAPFRSPRDGAGPNWFDQLSRPVFLAVFALLLGALVLILLPARRDEPVVKAQAPPAATTPAVAETLVAGAAPVAEPTTAVAPAAASPAAATPVAASPAPAAPAPATTTAPAVAVAAPAPAVGKPVVDGIVVFKARGNSWIQVTDAKGTVSLRKQLAAGESAVASGVLPLSVTVGSVSVTDVQVRGKPFDMAPLARDNVARFEVK
jgi:cytoskeleton protein RodZ